MGRCEQLPVRMELLQSDPPHVTTVVLNWNGATVTLKCLEHLSVQSFHTDVIVIDNGSKDDSVARMMASAPPGCEVVSLQENLGFAEGMNVGIRSALSRGADYVWLLNNDAFAEPDCLEQLVLAMRGTLSLAMVTPRLIEPTGAEQHAGGVMDWTTGNTGPRKSRELCGPAAWGTWLTGTAPLIRMDAIKVAGLFDPAFFAYWEDVDLSVRLFRAGGDLRAVPSAVVHHAASSSTGGLPSPFYQFLMVRNEWLLLRKHRSARSRPADFVRFVARSLQNAEVLDRKGHGPAAKAVLGGISAAALGRYGEPRIPTVPNTFCRAILQHRWRAAPLLDWVAQWLDRFLAGSAVSP